MLLPATETARRPDIRTVSSPRTAQAGVGSILFVDDDAALRMIAQRALERHGYDVLLAENGREAISVLGDHPEVRAIVLDLAMPVMGGDIAGPMIRALRPRCATDSFQRLLGIGRVGTGRAGSGCGVPGKTIPGQRAGCENRRAAPQSNELVVATPSLLHHPV